MPVTIPELESRPRSVLRVVETQLVSEGAGVRLRRSIASRALDYLDPFLLLDDFRSDNPDDYIAGFPVHPHRGIETVTYMLAGEVHHRDTLGNSGTIGPGDVQWMTAGGGIMHEEMPRPRQGKMGGFQLWVNLPARPKMMPPRYQEVRAASIPEIVGEDNVMVRVIAGLVNGTRGAVTEIAAHPSYLDVFMPASGAFAQPIERGHAAFAYVFEGRATFGITGEGGVGAIDSPRLVVFDDGDYIEVHTDAAHARFLLVSGKPLREPIARYGPFVMNTREEIEQALRDLRQGTFVRQRAA
jgi:redox-sensitive bicupin YhaK (pirin superfamily)